MVSFSNPTSLLFGVALCHHDLPKSLAACIQLRFPSLALDCVATSYLCLRDTPRSCANPARPLAACRNLTGSPREEAMQEVPVSFPEAGAP